MRIGRRRLLTLLGLGGLSLGMSGLGRSGVARAIDPPPPKRLVYWITAHGTIPRYWNLDLPGVPTDRVATAALSALSLGAMPQILQPLYDHRRKLTCVEGLAHTTLLAEHAAEIGRTDIDDNDHRLAAAHLLTCVSARQAMGTECLGGGPSIDQVIGDRTRSGSRWASRVYGVDQLYDRPFSFTDAGVASARVSDPAQAFADLMGLYVPPGSVSSRDELIRAARGSLLGFVGDEYAYASARLGTEGRRKLEQHAQLVRDLEVSFSSLAPDCALEADGSGHVIDVWNRIIALVLACDLSRVVTFCAPIIESTDIGYPASPGIHEGYAHSSFDDGSEPFKPESETAMMLYNRWYAARFASLLDRLDGILEGAGTLLDHSTVVWLTELGTPTHQHVNVPVVVAGGGDGFFRSDTYVRYPRSVPTPYAMRHTPDFIGPGLSRFHVTCMRAMGLADDSFGMEEIPLLDGSMLSLRDPLEELLG